MSKALDSSDTPPPADSGGPEAGTDAPDRRRARNGHPLRRKTDGLAGGLGWLAEAVGLTWSLVGRSFLILVAIGLAIGVFREVYRDSIAIDPIAIPEELRKRGYTPEIVAQRLTDELLRIRNRVSHAELYRQGVPDADWGQPQIDLERQEIGLQVELPGTGITLHSAVRYLREFFGVQGLRIGGEITRDDGRLALRLRAHGKGRIKPWQEGLTMAASDASDGPSAPEDDAPRDTEASLDSLLHAGARDIVKMRDPYLLALYQFSVEPSSAEAMIRYCLEHEPEQDDAWAHNLLGVMHLTEAREHLGKGNKGRAAAMVLLEKAKASFRDSIAVRQDFYAAYNLWGTTQFHTGEYDEALARYRKAASLEPDRAKPHHNMGIVRNHLGANAMNDGDEEEGRRQFEQAVSHFRAALTRYEDETELEKPLSFHASFGDALLHSGKHDEAIEQYRFFSGQDTRANAMAAAVYFNWAEALSRKSDAGLDSLSQEALVALAEDALLKLSEARKNPRYVFQAGAKASGIEKKLRELTNGQAGKSP